MDTNYPPRAHCLRTTTPGPPGALLAHYHSGEHYLHQAHVIYPFHYANIDNCEGDSVPKAMRMQKEECHRHDRRT